MVTVTLYVPGANPGNEYAPVLFVTTGASASPVATFLITPVAPGTGPSLSFTTPLSVARVEPPWANTGEATTANASASAVIKPTLAISPSPTPAPPCELDSAGRGCGRV